MTLTYGDKRDYRKIDIFINGRYEASTTWARTCKEAVEMFRKSHGNYLNSIDKLTAKFSKINY